jgi:hypothetical protein
MFEADNQLKLLPLSIFDIYKVFEHIDMLPICVVNLPTVAALNRCTHTPRRHLPPRLCCPPCQPGVCYTMALIVLALLPLLHWHCQPCCAGVAVVCGVVYHAVCGLVHASSTRVKKPEINCTIQAQQGQRGLRNEGNNASATRATTPV